MGRWTAERWAAASGIAFAVVVVIGTVIAGVPPKYDSPTSKIVSYIRDHHKALAFSSILTGLALVLLLWFIASFAGTMRDAGQGRLSTIMYGAGVATVALAGVTDAYTLGLSRLVYFTDAKTIHSQYGMSLFVFDKVFWTILALSLATTLAVRRSRVLPEWYGWLTAAGSVVFLLAAVSVKTAGFFGPGGGMQAIGFFVFAVWIAVSSALLVQRTATPTATM